MMKNVNHRNSFIEEETIIKTPVKEIKKEVKEEPKKEEIKEIEKVYPSTVEDIYDLTKNEQIVMLTELGISKNEIKKLKLEKARVDKILSLI